MPAPAAPPAAEKTAAGPLTLPLPAEAVAAMRGGRDVRFLNLDTGAALALSPAPECAADALADWADAQPLPTREEVEAQMGRTFGEALRDAIAEHEANPDAAVPWAEARARIVAAVPALRAAYGVEGDGG